MLDSILKNAMVVDNDYRLVYANVERYNCKLHESVRVRLFFDVYNSRRTVVTVNYSCPLSNHRKVKKGMAVSVDVDSMTYDPARRNYHDVTNKSGRTYDDPRTPELIPQIEQLLSSIPLVTDRFDFKEYRNY